MEVAIMIRRHLRCSASAVLVLLTIGAATRVEALSGGITTQSFGPSGCNQCHFGGTTPTVTLTGPTVVDPNTSYDYTLQIVEGGSQNFAGLNVSALIGVLATGGADPADTQTLTGTGGRAEVTHT